MNMYQLLTMYCDASECIVWQMDNMILCDGNYYDWMHMAWTRCIIGNPEYFKNNSRNNVQCHRALCEYGAI